MSVITLNTILQNRLAQLEQAVGNTPLYELTGFELPEKVKLYAKLEWHQIGSSVKARAAYNIIKQALLSGELHDGVELLDASSGNTGVAFGAITAALGIPATLCVPENASELKKASLRAFGVNIVYTSRFGGSDEAQEKAKELVAKDPSKYFYADQYANEHNWKAHVNTTAQEILEQTNGQISHFVTGLGTSGTFTGTTIGLKAAKPDLVSVALHPEIAMHGLEGWKHMETALVPKIYRPELADRNEKVDSEEAYKVLKETALSEGLLLSPSSAANLTGALKVANELDEGVVVTIFPDHGSNYPEVIKELLN